MGRISNPFRRSGTVAIATAFILTAVSGFSGNTAAQQRAAMVHVDKVSVEPLEQTAAVLGRFVARQSGDIAARVPERVSEVLVQVGDRVKKGDVLVRLSPDRLQQERNLRAADYKKAQASVTRALASSRKARQALDRAKRLQGSNAFRQDRVDDLEREYEAAISGHSAAEADLIRAEAQLKLAQIALRDAEIRAPYPGVVSVRHVVAGRYVRSGDPVVAVLNDMDLEIEADVPVDKVGGLVPGSMINARLMTGETLFAAVRAVVPEDNSRTRTRAVRLVPELGDKVGSIASNQSVTIQVPIGATRDVVSVHKDAITLMRGQKMVYVVADGKAQPRPVRTGSALGNRFEVVGGLKPGETVVIRGNERLRPGQAVKPVPAS